MLTGAGSRVIWLLQMFLCLNLVVVLKKTLECPLDSKDIKPVNPKGNQPWIFIGRTDAETEAPILWPPDAKNRLIRQDLDAGKHWGQEEKWMTDDEMVGWYHWLSVLEFDLTLGHSEGQGSLVYCSPWGCKQTRFGDWTTATMTTTIFFCLKLIQNMEFKERGRSRFCGAWNLYNFGGPH